MNKREKLLWNMLVGVSLLTLSYIYYSMFIGQESYFRQSTSMQYDLNNKKKNKESVNKNFSEKVSTLNLILENRARKKISYLNNPMNPAKINIAEGSNSASIKRGILCSGAMDEAQTNGIGRFVTGFCEYQGEAINVQLNDAIGSGGIVAELTTRHIVITFNDDSAPIEFEFWKD